jgi:RNA polymerase-binding protein DksA
VGLCLVGTELQGATVAKQAPKKSPKKMAKPAAKKAPARITRPAAKAAKPVARSARPQPAARPVMKAARPSRPAPAVAQFVRREPPPVIAPVPTNGKPRKNQAGLNAKDLEHFRDLLLQKRRELIGDMGQMEREALRSAGGSNLSNLPLHMADMGTDNYEQEFTLGLVEKDRNVVREINQALAKIMDGSYGICEGTGKPISKVRLEAQPWAKYSIEYARQMEKGFIR